MRSFRELEEAATVKALQCKQLYRGMRHWEAAKLLVDPNINLMTHCKACGLSLANHVEHEPAEITKLKPEDTTKAGVWGPYLQAIGAHYRGALRHLTDEELLRMPLPLGQQRCYVVAAEARARHEAQPEPQSAWERLMGEDDF